MEIPRPPILNGLPPRMSGRGQVPWPYAQPRPQIPLGLAQQAALALCGPAYRSFAPAARPPSPMAVAVAVEFGGHQPLPRVPRWWRIDQSMGRRGYRLMHFDARDTWGGHRKYDVFQNGDVVDEGQHKVLMMNDQGILTGNHGEFVGRIR
jgi:hypothetical protein